MINFLVFRRVLLLSFFVFVFFCFGLPLCLKGKLIDSKIPSRGDHILQKVKVLRPSPFSFFLSLSFLEPFKTFLLPLPVVVMEILFFLFFLFSCFQKKQGLLLSFDCSSYFHIFIFVFIYFVFSFFLASLA